MLPNSGRKIKVWGSLSMLYLAAASCYALWANRAAVEDYLIVLGMQALLTVSLWMGLASGLILSLLVILVYGGYLFVITFVKQMRADITPREMLWFLAIPAGAAIGGSFGEAVSFVERLFHRYRRQLTSLLMSGQLGMIGDRATLEVGLREECARSSRSLATFALVLIDVCNMDDIHRLLGADASVQVSHKISEVLVRCTRDVDRKARLEGIRHAVVIVDSDTGRTNETIARIKRDLTRADMEYRGRFIKVPVQIATGIATFPESGDSPQALLQAAQVQLQQGLEESPEPEISSQHRRESSQDNSGTSQGGS